MIRPLLFAGAILAAAAAALLGTTSCRDLKKDGTVCPEFRNLRCIAGTRCSLDKNRGCKVCQCDEMDMDRPTSGPDDPSVPPPTE